MPTFGLRINSIFNDIPIELRDIAEYQEPENPVWTVDQPVIRLDLRVRIKKDIHPTNCIQLFNNFKCTYENYKFIYTDGSQTEHTVGCAALMGSTSLKENLPSTSSIYTAELRAILIAFELINKSYTEHFVICTDLVSSLMSIRNLKQDHPLLPNIFDSYACM